jgi:HlyD family secretion protein
MKKKSIIITIVIVAAIVAVALYLFTGKGKVNKVTFETTKVSRSDISTSVTATGTLEAVTKVEVGTQVSGIVTKILVDYNSVVKKGQVIAELDKTNLEAELSSKRASLESARSEYDYQLKNYKRYKLLYAKQLVSQSDYDSALDSYSKAQQSYDMAKNDYSKARTNLSYATITSPIDGVVLSRAVEVGQTVAASFSTPTLFIIAKDLTDMQVVADVDEADIGEVVTGQRVSFTVDAYPDDTFEGTVKQVRQNATTTNNVVTYEVVITAPNPTLKLKPGLTANITIYTQEKKNVLSVPSKALRFSPEKPLIGDKDKVVDCNAAHKLWTRDGMTFTAHAVQIGINNGIRTEIISGVKEGDKVILDAIAGKMPGDSSMSSDSASSSSDNSSPFMPKHPDKKKSNGGNGGAK